jgi:hypothetical protein
VRRRPRHVRSPRSAPCWRLCPRAGCPRAKPQPAVYHEARDRFISTGDASRTRQRIAPVATFAFGIHRRLSRYPYPSGWLDCQDRPWITPPHRVFVTAKPASRTKRDRRLFGIRTPLALSSASARWPYNDWQSPQRAIVPRGATHGMSILTSEQINDIRTRYESMIFALVTRRRQDMLGRLRLRENLGCIGRQSNILLRIQHGTH